MEPVLFYGVPKGCSFGSIVALEWLGQPYRLCRIDMMARPELYAQVNPLRETPALLLETGAVLTQSVAILQNIAARDLRLGLGAAQGTAEFDRFNQALAYLATSFFASFGPYWTSYKMEGEPAEREMLRALGRQQVNKAHAALDAMLGDREWLAGETRTVADAYFIGVARWAAYHQAVDPADYPNLARHIAKLEADPAVIFAHAVEDERPAVSAGGFLGHVRLEDLVPRLAA